MVAVYFLAYVALHFKPYADRCPPCSGPTSTTPASEGTGSGLHRQLTPASHPLTSTDTDFGTHTVYYWEAYNAHHDAG
jgi:hypothetical protein